MYSLWRIFESIYGQIQKTSHQGTSCAYQLMRQVGLSVNKRRLRAHLSPFFLKPQPEFIGFEAILGQSAS